MMNCEEPTKKSPIRRLSTLLILVLFVFAVLLASFALAGLTVVFLLRRGFIAPISGGNFYGVLIFLLLVSLAISTIISAIGGTLFLRPLRRLIDATKQVAAGDFEVDVEPTGPYEMQRLTSSFNEMAHELSGIETLRSDFVSNVSHEFKTPVASIRGFARLLKRGGLEPAQQEEYLDIILLESERLTQLSGNVLLLSNLENTQTLPDAAPFSLDEQLRQSVLLLHPHLERKNLSVEVELQPATLTGSEDMLKQLWLNLLNNAVKFTPEGGCIQIELATSGDSAVVTIADDGIGMSEEVQRHLFDKFYQGDTSRATQGNGLGLSLVRRILLLSGGEIEVHSAEGEGSVFIVTLPLISA